MPTVYNKVTLNNTTLIDLSGDTVASSDDIAAGKVGHLNDGTQVTGTLESGGSSITTVTFYDDGYGMGIFGGDYITYVDGNGNYQHTTSLKDPSSDPESYQMLSKSILTYASTLDPAMGGSLTAPFTGMTLVDTKNIAMQRGTVYLRYYQVD